MQQLFPDLKTKVERIARGLRSGRRSSAGKTQPARDLARHPMVVSYVTEYALRLLREGMPKDAAVIEGDLLGAHLSYMINFELHHRKTFWVEERLAWMFEHTELDIEGSCLKLPFPSCAFLYTDRPTLEIGEALLRRDGTSQLVGQQLQILTVHVTEHPAEDATVLAVCMLFDSCSGKWPYLLSRDLHIRADDRLDAILNSYCPGVEPDARDPIFTAPETKRLLHLVMNSILYATTAHPSLLRRASPVAALERELSSRKPQERALFADRLSTLRRTYTQDDVFFLPGKIDIGSYQRLSGARDSGGGSALLTRFMVRGHWRRANPDWKQQHLRWIEPYWKGPEGTITVEKEYRMGSDRTPSADVPGGGARQPPGGQRA